MSEVNTPAICQNGAVLSNAAALASSIIFSLGERDVSRTLNEESLTRDKIEHLVLTKLTNSITE